MNKQEPETPLEIMARMREALGLQPHANLTEVADSVQDEVADCSRLHEEKMDLWARLQASEQRAESYRAALEIAVEVMTDLGACQDEDCREPNCRRGIATARAALSGTPGETPAALPGDEKAKK